MDSILVFIDGTICDTRHRHHLLGGRDFYLEDNILGDLPTPGSVDCMAELSRKYRLIYIGARPEAHIRATQKWLSEAGFPGGDVYLGQNQQDRLKIAMELKDGDNRIVAGIGDRWDDNELHLAIGCMSIILQEWEPNWDTVRRYLL